MADIVWAKYAFEAERMRSRLMAPLPSASPTLLRRVVPEPWPLPFAGPQRRGPCGVELDSGGHLTSLSALAANGDVHQIPAGPSLVHPQGAATLVIYAVNEGIPIDVADVTARAGLDEPNRHDFELLPIYVIPPFCQVTTMDERPRPQGGTWRRRHLGDEPLRELPRRDSRDRRVGVVAIRRRGEELHGLRTQQLADLGREPLLGNRIVPVAGPVVQTCRRSPRGPAGRPWRLGRMS